MSKKSVLIAVIVILLVVLYYTIKFALLYAKIKLAFYIADHLGVIILTLLGLAMVTAGILFLKHSKKEA